MQRTYLSASIWFDRLIFNGQKCLLTQEKYREITKNAAFNKFWGHFLAKTKIDNSDKSNAGRNPTGRQSHFIEKIFPCEEMIQRSKGRQSSCFQRKLAVI